MGQGEAYGDAGRVPDENIWGGGKSGGVQRGFGSQYAVDVYLDVCRVVVAFQNIQETDGYIADGAVDFYRGGFRFAGDGENV